MENKDKLAVFLNDKLQKSGIVSQLIIQDYLNEFEKLDNGYKGNVLESVPEDKVI